MKILIVSPFFPPSATVAIARVSSLAHELLKEGHELTIIRNNYMKEDHQLSNSDSDLMNLKTYKVNVDQSIRYFEASRRYKAMFRKVMNQGSYDLVFITAGPFYTIPLCTIAKKEYNTKCIIDYRDLWIFDIRNKKDFFKPLNLVKKIVYFPIEYRNIKHADLVVTVTKDWFQILKSVYKKDKFKIVANGYDDKQLSNIKPTSTFLYKGKFVIAVFGKLAYYSVDYGVEFFKAMKALSKRYPDILILHIGLPEKETEKALKISGYDSKKYINTGFVEYKEGISLLKESNLCVLIDIRKGAMGTKFYDYVFVNKPLLYLGKKNTQIDRLVSEFKNGFPCYYEKDIIEAVMKIKDNNLYSLTNNYNIEKYSRTKQNKKYIELIENTLHS